VTDDDEDDEIDVRDRVSKYTDVVRPAYEIHLAAIAWEEKQDAYDAEHGWSYDGAVKVALCGYNPAPRRYAPLPPPPIHARERVHPCVGCGALTDRRTAPRSNVWSCSERCWTPPRTHKKREQTCANCKKVYQTTKRDQRCCFSAATSITDEAVTIRVAVPLLSRIRMWLAWQMLRARWALTRRW